MDGRYVKKVNLFMFKPEVLHVCMLSMSQLVGGRCELPVVGHIKIAALPAVPAVFACFQCQLLLGWGLRLGVPSRRS